MPRGKKIYKDMNGWVLNWVSLTMFLQITWQGNTVNILNTVGRLISVLKRKRKLLQSIVETSLAEEAILFHLGVIFYRSLDLWPLSINTRMVSAAIWNPCTPKLQIVTTAGKQVHCVWQNHWGYLLSVRAQRWKLDTPNNSMGDTWRNLSRCHCKAWSLNSPLAFIFPSTQSCQWHFILFLSRFPNLCYFLIIIFCVA